MCCVVSRKFVKALSLFILSCSCYLKVSTSMAILSISFHTLGFARLQNAFTAHLQRRQAFVCIVLSSLGRFFCFHIRRVLMSVQSWQSLIRRQVAAVVAAMLALPVHLRQHPRLLAEVGREPGMNSMLLLQVHNAWMPCRAFACVPRRSQW